MVSVVVSMGFEQTKTQTNGQQLQACAIRHTMFLSYLSHVGAMVGA